MILGSRGSRSRCLVVGSGATAALVVTGWVTRAGVTDAATAVARHRLDLLPLDRALTDLAAAVLLGCAAWLWLLTSYVVLEAARGQQGHPSHWVPTTAPSVVHSRVSGLPLPERAAVARRPGPGPARPDRPVATVVVAAGDTLWSIAVHSLPADAPDSLVAERWHAIYAANRGRIGPDPDLIIPGLLLHLPGKERR